MSNSLAPHFADGPFGGSPELGIRDTPLDPSYINVPLAVWKACISYERSYHHYRL